VHSRWQPGANPHRPRAHEHSRRPPSHRGETEPSIAARCAQPSGHALTPSAVRRCAEPPAAAMPTAQRPQPSGLLCRAGEPASAARLLCPGGQAPSLPATGHALMRPHGSRHACDFCGPPLCVCCFRAVTVSKAKSEVRQLHVLYQFILILDNVLFLYIYRELFYKLIGCVLNIIIRSSCVEPYLIFFHPPPLLPHGARGRGVTDEADPPMWSVGPILQASPHSSVLAYKKDTETLSVGSAYRVFLPARLLPPAQHVRTCMGVGDVVGRWLRCSQWREGLVFGGTEKVANPWADSGTRSKRDWANSLVFRFKLN
jgi:hypothetical protein